MPNPENQNQREANIQNLQRNGWEFHENDDAFRESRFMSAEINAQMQLNEELQSNKRRGFFGKEKDDSETMQLIKKQMQDITVRLNEPMAEELSAFRAQIGDMAARYTSVIAVCDKYLGTFGKRRKDLVSKVKKAAERGRICFSNAGASDRLFEQRDEASLLGNVLSNMELQYETIDTNFEITDQLEERCQNLDYIEKSTEQGEYIVSKDRYRLDDELRRCQLTTVLSDFLGTGLVRRTQLVKSKDQAGKTHYGIKRDRKFNDHIDSTENDEDLTPRQLREKYEKTGGVKFIYSPEALRQLSVIQVMNALMGRTKFDPENDILLVNQNSEDVARQRGEAKRPTIIHVTGVYMDTAFGDAFHRGAFGSDIKRGKGGLEKFDMDSIPFLDKEFAGAVLAMQPGDMAFLSKNLITPGEERAFESRLKYVQEVLRNKLAEDEGRPARQKTVLERDEWEKAVTLKTLQTQLKSGEKANGLQNLYKKVDRIEGITEGATDDEIYYDKVYNLFRDKLKRAATPAERYSILSDLNLGSQTVTDTKDNHQQIRKGAANQICLRLVEEFMDKETIEYGKKKEFEDVKALRRVFNEKALQIQEVPEEFINREKYNKRVDDTKKSILRNAAARHQNITQEEALLQAQRKISEDLKYGYIKYLIIRDNLDVVINLEHSRAGRARLSLEENTNRKMKPGAGKLIQMVYDVNEKILADVGEEEYQRLMDFGQEFENTAGVGDLIKEEKVRDALELRNEASRAMWDTPLAEFGLDEGTLNTQNQMQVIEALRKDRARNQGEPEQVPQQIEAPQQNVQAGQNQQQNGNDRAQQEEPHQIQRFTKLYQTLTGAEKEDRGKELTEYALKVRKNANKDKPFSGGGVFIQEPEKLTKSLAGSFRDKYSENARKRRAKDKSDPLFAKSQNVLTIEEAEALALNSDRELFERTNERKDALSLLKSILELDVFDKHLTDDEEVVKNAPVMEALLSRLAVYDRLNQDEHCLETFDEKTGKQIGEELRMLRLIASYYAVRKDIIMDPYYRDHYNEELSLNITEQSTDAQKALAKKLLKAASLTELLRGKGYDLGLNNELSKNLFSEASQIKEREGMVSLISDSFDASKNRYDRKIGNNEFPESRIIESLKLKKTLGNTAGDQLLDQLITDMTEVSRSIKQRVGDDLYNEKKQNLDMGLLYAGSHEERNNFAGQIVGSENTDLVFKLLIKEIINLDINEFTYRNEDEFKQKFVRNYKLLLTYEDYYKKSYGSDFMPELRNLTLPKQKSNGDLEGRLLMLLEIKADYDRRIKLLQGRDDKTKTDLSFKMGKMDISSALTKKINQAKKKDAAEIGALAVEYEKQLSAMTDKNPDKYVVADENGEEVINYDAAALDFAKQLASKKPVQDYTDDVLLKQKSLDIPYDTQTGLEGGDIIAIEKTILSFKNSPDYANLPIRVRAEFDREMDKYRAARKKHASGMNVIQVRNDITSIFDREASFKRDENGNKQAEFDRNPYFTKEQKKSLGYIGLVFELADQEYIEKDGNLEGLSNDVELVNSLRGFTEWRLEHGIKLTEADARWQELIAHERGMQYRQEFFHEVTINFDGRSEHMTVFTGKQDGGRSYTLDAHSQEELDEIKRNLLELDASSKKIMTIGSFIKDQLENNHEPKGVFYDEILAQKNIEARKSAVIFGAYFEQENANARKELIFKKLKSFEDAGDYQGFGDELLKLFKKAGDDHALIPEEAENARQYLDNFGKALKAVKKREALEGGNKPKSKEELFMENLRDYLAHTDLMLRVDAGKKMTEFEERIRNKEFNDTEYLTEKQKVQAAHDLVHLMPEGKKYMASNQARLAFFEATEPYCGDTNYLMSGKVREDADEYARNQNEVPFEVARGYVDKASDFDLKLSHIGYNLKENYQEGRDIFETIPESITTLKAKTDQEVSSEIDKNNQRIDAAVAYETEVLKVKNTAGNLFAELKAAGIAMADSSAEYLEFYRELENVTMLGEGSYLLRSNDVTTVSGDINTKFVDFALTRLLETGTAIAESDKYPQIRELARNAAGFAQGSKTTLSEKAGILNYRGPVNKTVNDAREKIRLLGVEAGKRNLQVAAPNEKEPETKNLSGLHTEKFRHERNIQYSRIFHKLIELKKSEPGVNAGNREYDQMLSTIVEYLNVYRTYMESENRNDADNCIAAINQGLALKNDLTSKAKAFIDAMKAEGLTAKKGDERSKNRISLVENFLKYALAESGNAMNYALRQYNAPDQAHN